MSNNRPIIVAGPTGVGKTLFAVELAIRLDGEIIGADAYQVYRGLGVLTSQPEPELLARVPHHLVGILPPSEPFDAARFAALAREKIAEIASRQRLPILVGGSGLYLKALTHGLAEVPASDPALRAELTALSAEECRARLESADPTAREHIDLQNPHRVLRALEIFLLTGCPTAESRRGWEKKETPDFRGIVLWRERSELDARISANVDAMFARGVIDEIARLENPGPTARMAIGLREIQSFIRGEITAEACRAAIVLATRRYAKRQLTWFRNQFTFPLIDLTGPEETLRSLPTALHALGAVA